MTKRISLAIIGCGAAGVSFLRSLIHFALSEKIFDLDVTIFESADALGAGLAYQKDLDNLLVNRPLQTMAASTKLDEFLLWLQKHPDLYKHRIIESDQEGDQRAYISRWIFGLYLEDMMKETVLEAKKQGIQVRIENSQVTEIHALNPFSIEAGGEDVFFADFLVFCTGNNLPRDVHRLNGSPKYIHSPYPISTHLQPIEKDASVGIIGNSLTSVDIAISMKKLGHTGPITMMSRMYAHPRVRGKMVPRALNHLTREAILQRTKKNRSFTLWESIRLFRRDLKEIDFDWRILFREDDKKIDFKTLLEKEIEAAQTERKWQAVLSATNKIIDFWWHSLDLQSKALFLTHFHRTWLNNRSPIPVTNAKILHSMAAENQLRYITPIKKIIFRADQNQYIGSFDSGREIEFDWIINATGPSRFVEEEDALLFGLIEKGHIRENAFGGIDIDFDSSSLIDENGKKNPHMRLIGHNALGVYYYTSSLEMIVRRAEKVAQDVVKFISQNGIHA